MSRFVQLTTFKEDETHLKVTKWRSPTTGLQIVYLDKPLPFVKARLVFATEILDDSGIPAALARLVFMGSKKYPYKGLIKNLRGRLLSRIHTYTHKDHTEYELRTIGWERFKTMLLILLDHLFHPTLTDEAFLTEVYHIDGKGQEGGKLYFNSVETESRKYRYGFTMDLNKLLYAANSGYLSHQYGQPSEIRKLKNSQIRDYHRSIYCPKNFCLVITGSIDEEELLSIMSDFDTQLLPLADQIEKRPFVDSPHDLPLVETIVKSVEYTSGHDFGHNELRIGWIGPKYFDHVDSMALDIIGRYSSRYLTENVSFKIIVDYMSDQYLRKYFGFEISSRVEIVDLEQIDRKLKSLLAQSADPKNIDLETITNLAKSRFSCLSSNYFLFLSLLFKTSFMVTQMV